MFILLKSSFLMSPPGCPGCLVWIGLILKWPGLDQNLDLDRSLTINILGLFLYDDIFPSQLKGKGPNGSEVTLNVCPELGSEVITDFDQNTVQHIYVRVDLFSWHLMQIMTPELNPCFYFISARGFDRILTIFSHLFGGFIEVANQVLQCQATAEPIHDLKPN